MRPRSDATCRLLVSASRFSRTATPNTRAAGAYGVEQVSERHRHRYEVSNRYRETFVKNGMALSGLSPDNSLVEIVELVDHPWFVGCQFHPVLKARPTRAHPLFRGFIEAATAHRNAATKQNGAARDGVPNGTYDARSRVASLVD